MAITIGNHTQVAGTDGGTTPDISTAAAKLLIAGASYFDAINSVTVTDSLSNIWIPLTAYGGQNRKAQLFYAANPNVGTTHNFTLSGVNTFSALYVLAVNGAAVASPFDSQNGASSDGDTSLATGSISPGQDGEIIVSVCSDDDFISPLVSPGGFTIVEFQSSPVAGALAYLIQTSAASVQATWSCDQSLYGAAIAGFKAASGSSLKRNSLLAGLGASGPFFQNPLN